MKLEREITKLYIKKNHGFICYPYLRLYIQKSGHFFADAFNEFHYK